MESLTSQYLTYDDNAGLGKAAPSLDTLEFVQGDKAAALAAPLKVVLFCAKFDKGGGPLWLVFKMPGSLFLA